VIGAIYLETGGVKIRVRDGRIGEGAWGALEKSRRDAAVFPDTKFAIPAISAKIGRFEPTARARLVANGGAGEAAIGAGDRQTRPELTRKAGTQRVISLTPKRKACAKFGSVLKDGFGLCIEADFVQNRLAIGPLVIKQ